MRVRPRFLPLCLVPFFALGHSACANQTVDEPEAIAHAQQALGGIEGTFEYALDAPWRIEPSTDSTGATTYGAVPIQISIHDANMASADRGSVTSEGTTRTLGNFCELVVNDGANVRRHYNYNDLTEIESTTGAWTPTGAAPPHQVCKPSNGNCAALQNIGPTSEWHATAWYWPWGGAAPGSNRILKLAARIGRDTSVSCTDTDPSKFYTLTNYVNVHFGEAPLPRFDNGWLYGDVHYHSQGTDNEGESGYHYRGVMRAMGALGVDFAFATEHASNSEQIVDVDLSYGLGKVYETETGGVLRDMNLQRFQMLRNELWRSGGVNGDALVGADGGYPQGFKSHNVVPRLFVGGEVDTIPEINKSRTFSSGYTFGNGLFYDPKVNLCGGWLDTPITIDGSCDPNQTYVDAGDMYLFRDVQGVHAYDYSRSHMVMLPSSSTNTNAFVPSYTGHYGGGGRRLSQFMNGKAPLLPEMESKGYAFIAHPIPIGGCPTSVKGNVGTNGSALTTGMDGGEGPDMVPWTDDMLAQAMSSPAILGMEFWNEDTRLCTKTGQGDAKEIGYESQYPNAGEAVLDDPIRKYERVGFSTGQFELRPFANQSTGAFGSMSTGVEWMLHHGSTLWDRMLRKGLDPAYTASITWLASGDPRRFFIAGGSDAHGDFNYRREGYMTGTTTITDTAIAKVRNLVGVGAPQKSILGSLGTDVGAVLVSDATSATPTTSTTPTKTTIGGKLAASSFAVDTMPTATIDPTVSGTVIQPPVPHTQGQIVDTLKDGNFAVTDGPALRIAIDRNRNGVIDAGDTNMGGIVELYGEETLPLLVEWKSTAEFGNVTDVQLYVGVEAGGSSMTYAVQNHGTQSVGNASSAVSWSYTSNGRTYSMMKDGYMIDPTGMLRVSLPAGSGMSGVRKIDLPIAAFEAGIGRRPERMYVRAFAATQQHDPFLCTTDAGQKSGACIRRYAYTNPIWAINGDRPGGVCPTGRPRALDRDGDGYPDGCDSCPSFANNAICGIIAAGSLTTMAQ